MYARSVSRGGSVHAGCMYQIGHWVEPPRTPLLGTWMNKAKRKDWAALEDPGAHRDALSSLGGRGVLRVGADYTVPTRTKRTPDPWSKSLPTPLKTSSSPAPAFMVSSPALSERLSEREVAVVVVEGEWVHPERLRYTAR